MSISQIIQFAISIATLIGMAIVFYRTFRDPDIKADKSIALLKEQLEQEREISKGAIKTIQNDLHALEIEIKNNRDELQKVCISVVKLETIIDERIPKK